MGESVVDNKAQLRTELRALRKSLSPEERMRMDSALCEKVCALPSYREATMVFAYLAFGEEVETRGIIEQAWSDGKEVALPRCTGPREMRWFRIADFNDFEKSPLGVEEPRIDERNEVYPRDHPQSIAIVPGLTFDDSGYRLGYGGGFYDTFLEGYPGTSVGICRSAQRRDNLVDLGVIEAWDKPVDIVVFD